MPIHRHKDTSETCVCVRGHFEEYLYGFTEIRSDGTQDPDSFGIVETIDMFPGGPFLNIEKGQWHSLKCLESGTVLLEAKDGGYRPLEEDEVMERELGLRGLEKECGSLSGSFLCLDGDA